MYLMPALKSSKNLLIFTFYKYIHHCTKYVLFRSPSFIKYTLKTKQHKHLGKHHMNWNVKIVLFNRRYVCGL